MQDVHKTPAVAATARKTRDLDTDLLIIPVFDDDTLGDEADLDRASGGEYAAARKRGELRAPGEVDATVVERGRVLGEATNMARALSNEPGNVLTPREFADRAAALAKDAGLGVEVLDEKRIADLEMGLLLGVARGS